MMDRRESVLYHQIHPLIVRQLADLVSVTGSQLSAIQGW
jgi:hypothetical protein